jgi:hypothetical protein
MGRDESDRLLWLASQGAARGCRDCSTLLEQFEETHSDKDMEALSIHLRGPAHRDELDPAVSGLATYIALEALADAVADDEDEGEGDDDDW